MSRILGLRKPVCAKEDWYYLVFYDIDKEKELTQSDLEQINMIMLTHKCSYLVYKTKHGYHIIGLTPLTAIQWANTFTALKFYFQSYYSGDTIRLSRKKDETQVLVRKVTEFGEVIPNLYNLYADRFNYPKLPWTRETAKYLLVFEKYRSEKE